MGATLPDPSLNHVPGTVNHIHIMGICGTGMAALAGMLKEAGYFVTGSDRNVYPPMSDFLADAGIMVMEGYRGENLEPAPDLVVVGNVIRAVNPEALRMVEMGLPYLSMPQALANFFLEGYSPLVVAGTHGKTTTASLLATALHVAKASPGFMIGGIVEAFQRNFNLGQGRFFVVEGDEYDTAFFDKGSKFLHYRPEFAILTSIEFDHADIFQDLEMIKATFSSFVRLLPDDGALFGCGDDPVVREVARQAGCPVVWYGFQDDCDWRVSSMTPSGLTTEFELSFQETAFGSFSLPMPGRHNVLNATSVIALLHHLGFDREVIRQGLASFEGVKRRQQVRGEVNSITVIDDFAHHPTAVRETTAALRAAYPDRRLVIVFEPRTNSSRRSVFQKQYVGSFRDADLVLVREPVPLDNVPHEEQFSSAGLVADLRAENQEAHCFRDTDQILDYLADQAIPGDVIAILSNGGFDNIHERLLAKLA